MIGARLRAKENAMFPSNLGRMRLLRLLRLWGGLDRLGQGCGQDRLCNGGVEGARDQWKSKVVVRAVLKR